MKKLFTALFTLITLFSLGQGKYVGDGSFQPQGDFLITRFGTAQTGYWPLMRLTQRDSIPVWQRSFGMLVYVSNTDSVYQLKSITLDNTNWFAFKQGSVDLTNYVTAQRLIDSATAIQVRVQNKLTKSDADTYYTATQRFIDSLNAVQSRIQTKLNIADTGTMLQNYRRSATKITNADLLNNSISSIPLGQNLNNLNFGRGFNGGSYNGSVTISATLDTTKSYVWTGKNRYTDTISILNNSVLNLERDGIKSFIQKESNNAFVIKNQVYSAGGLGNSININRASSQYITIPTTGFTQSLSISFWFKTKSAGTHRLFQLGSSSGNYTRTIEINSSNNLLCYSYYNVGTYANLTTALNYVDNLWHHVAYTSNSVYIDNIKYDFPFTGFDTNVFTFGRAEYVYNGILYSDVFFDQLLVYNRDLTNAEVSLIYNSGAGLSVSSIPATSNLIRVYDFEESNPNSPIIDNNVAFNKYNATAINSPTYSGVGNGKTTTLGNLVEATPLASSNGLTNSEYGIHFVGDLSGRAVVRGMWFQFLQNNKTPFQSNNNGQFQINPNSNLLNTPPSIGSNNSLEIAKALAIGDNNLGISAPSNGLIVQGRSLFGTNNDNGVDQVQVNGSMIATSIKRSGGTSSQILAADGSVITAGSNITISGGVISSTGGGGGTTLNGNGLVRMAGTTVSYDNSTFITAETDPTVPANVKAITATNISNWNNAFQNRLLSATTITGITTGNVNFSENILEIPRYIGGTGVTNRLAFFSGTNDITSNENIRWNTSLNAIEIKRWGGNNVGQLAMSIDGGSLNIWNGNQLALLGGTVGNSGDSATLVTLKCKRTMQGVHFQHQLFFKDKAAMF
ncbi:MAG: LamG domain-containing protein [Sphingobacteriia bacterium]|nr:MAG: LamG domain-containing protein [Sphingobacteriia bacterium]